jgi:peptidoglycan hydrolase CwlO-like protein
MEEDLKKEIEVLKAIVDRLYISTRMDYEKIERLKEENERLKGQVRMLKYVIDPMKDT